MSTLQERIYAKKWLKLAISKNKLANFAIGLPPYAEIKSKYEAYFSTEFRSLICLLRKE